MPNATSRSHDASTPLRIAIIDSSAVVRGLVTRIVEGHGMQVVGSAGSGQSGLALFTRTAPHAVEADIILIDAHTHDTNGNPVIAPIRTHAPKARIIVTSTLNENNVMDSLDALDQGADELLPKPSSRKNTEETHAFTEELLAKISRLSGRTFTAAKHTATHSDSES